MSHSDQILQAYLKLTQHATQQFRVRFGQQDLTFPQALVLGALTDEAPIPISLLAERTGSANSTVSGIVDRLEKLGLVQRIRSEEDRRVIYVDLTPRYREMQENAWAKVKAYFANLMKDLTDEEQEKILHALLQLGKALNYEEARLI